MVYLLLLHTNMPENFDSEQLSQPHTKVQVTNVPEATNTADWSSYYTTQIEECTTLEEALVSDLFSEICIFLDLTVVMC